MSLISASLALLTAANPVADSPRLHKILIGGGSVFVEKMATPGIVSVQVIASARGTQDTPKTAGTRHLLEHLVALGRNGTVDATLEREGLYLSASTNRESSRYEVTFRRSQVEVVLKAFDELLSGLRVSEDDIKREARLIKEEIAAMSARRRRFMNLSELFAGNRAFDPLGDPMMIAQATPDKLKKLFETHFCQANIVVAVSGDLSIEEGVNWAERVVACSPTSPATALEWAPFPALTPTKSLTDDHWSLAMPYDDLMAPGSLATIIQGFGLAVLAGGEVSFSPAGRQGAILVDVPNTEAYRSSLNQSADAVTGVGYRALRRWIEAETSTPARSGALRGRLISAQPYFTPEKLVEGSATIAPQVRAKAWAGWHNLCRS